MKDRRVERIKEVYVDESRNCILGDSGGFYEPFTSNRAQLFRSLQREYGRCAGRMYVDRKVAVTSDPTCDGYRLEADPIGWVFERTEKYDDCDETFTRSVWVEVQP